MSIAASSATVSAIATSYPIVVFHDRGVGRESRHYQNGRILPKEGQDNEMLYPALFGEVEAQIRQGKTDGETSDPCYPNWLLGSFAPRMGVTVNSLGMVD